jgi:hypothetical protein
MQKAASKRDKAILNARMGQVAGGLLTLVGTTVAWYSLPTLAEGFFKEGAMGFFEFAHGGGLAYIGAGGPLAVGIGILSKGTHDVVKAWNQYYADTISCAAPVPSNP